MNNIELKQYRNSSLLTSSFQLLPIKKLIFQCSMNDCNDQ